MERRIAPRTTRAAAELTELRDARARLIDLAAQYRDPDRTFFPTPGAPEIRESLHDADGPCGTRIYNWKFASTYDAFVPAARALVDAVPENHTAYARLWTSGRGRPTIVVLHGWGSDNPWLNERAFVIPYWLAHGYDVAAFVLPYHGPRAPGPRSGALFPSANPLRTNEGFGQAIHDLRALALALRDRGASAVGAMGMSLGGYTTALWASIAGPADPTGVEFAVAMIPAVSFSRLFWQHGSANPTRRKAENAGVTEDLLADAFEIHSPLARPVLLTPERLAVIGGRGDRITPPEHAEQLAAHWRVPVQWFDGGHLVQLGRGESFRSVRRQLDALALPGQKKRP